MLNIYPMGPFSMFTNIVILFVVVNLAMLIYNAGNQKMREGMDSACVGKGGITSKYNYQDLNNPGCCDGKLPFSTREGDKWCLPFKSSSVATPPVPADPPKGMCSGVTITGQGFEPICACDTNDCQTSCKPQQGKYKYNGFDTDNAWNCDGCTKCGGGKGDGLPKGTPFAPANKNNPDPGQSEKDWESGEKRGIDTRGYKKDGKRPNRDNDVYIPIIPPYLPTTRCSSGIIDTIKRRTGKTPTSCISVANCKEVYSKNNEAAFCYKGDAITKALNNLRERSVPGGDYDDYTGDSGPSGAFDKDGTLDQDTRDAYNDALANDSPSMHGSRQYPSDTTGGEVVSSATTGMMTETRPGDVGGNLSSDMEGRKKKWLPANYGDYQDMKGGNKPVSYDSVWDLF